jgi:putative Mn2+ efflux pump MntP
MAGAFLDTLLSFTLFLLPLAVDTFAIAAAVGTLRPGKVARWRISAIFVLFEGGMPVVGLAAGHSVGHAVGDVAGYLSPALLILLGAYLWWAGDRDDEPLQARCLVSVRGLAVIGLGLTLSLDELGIGFGVGLNAGLAAPAVLVALIALQTVLASQLGLLLGGRISAGSRESIERLTGPLLLLLGAYLLGSALPLPAPQAVRGWTLLGWALFGWALLSWALLSWAALLRSRRRARVAQQATAPQRALQRLPGAG